MNLLQPFNLVFVVGCIPFFWIRHAFISRTRNEKKVVRRVDRQERILLFAVAVGCMFLPAIYLFTPLLAFADDALPPIVGWLGAGVMTASLWLFWRSHRDLGQNWSVSLELRENHQLVTHGVYRFIRHPMYASIWLWGAAQAMLLQNWLAGWATLAAFAAMYLLRVPREEQLMCDLCGEEYRQYMKRTGRLLPRFWKKP